MPGGLGKRSQKKLIASTIWIPGILAFAQFPPTLMAGLGDQQTTEEVTLCGVQDYVIKGVSISAFLSLESLTLEEVNFCVIRILEQP